MNPQPQNEQAPPPQPQPVSPAPHPQQQPPYGYGYPAYPIPMHPYPMQQAPPAPTPPPQPPRPRGPRRQEFDPKIHVERKPAAVEMHSNLKKVLIACAMGWVAAFLPMLLFMAHLYAGLGAIILLSGFFAMYARSSIMAMRYLENKFNIPPFFEIKNDQKRSSSQTK